MRMPKRVRLDDVETPPPKERPKYKYARRSPKCRLDYELIEFICVRIARGIPLTAIANSLCLEPTMLHEWRRRGESFIHNGSPEDWEIFGDFVMGMRAASGDYAGTLAKRIHKSKDWFRFFKIAERRMPETFGVDPRGGSDDIYDPDEEFL